MQLDEFYNSDFCQYSCYDNLRKIASVIDGQKNASRKILYTVLERNIKSPIKVLELAASIVSFAGYLHGDCSGVVVTLGQDFPGTNNLPLLQKKGNFGTRFVQEASAPRYIFTYGSDIFYKLFKKEDSNILINQSFEGSKIEPMFYLPTLPIILINGSEGISTGFSQKILPRNPTKIKDLITKLLKREKVTPGEVGDALTPWFKGFDGKVIPDKDDSSKWYIQGKFEHVNSSKILITEVPIGYDLRSYLKVLDNLEDSKFISSYKDLSDDDKFKFEVNIPRKTLQDLSDADLYNKLKLVKSITENYTVMDEHNKIQVFSTSKDILKYYLKVKLEYMSKRKEYLLNKYESDLNIAKSKYEFIRRIIDGSLVIYKRKKIDIIKDLEKIPEILRLDDYSYLLSMQVITFTDEKLKDLERQISNITKLIKSTSKKSVENMFVDDLEDLKDL